MPQSGSDLQSRGTDRKDSRNATQPSLDAPSTTIHSKSRSVWHNRLAEVATRPGKSFLTTVMTDNSGGFFIRITWMDRYGLTPRGRKSARRGVRRKQLQRKRK